MTPKPRLQFPDRFMWGAATAAHQIEGNNVNSDWWAREHSAGTQVDEPSGDACDSYHRFREDISLLASTGLNTYRFSLEWSRIEPEPGFISRAHIDHYRSMVVACHEVGLAPMVTLQHFTLPRWLADEGGWLRPDAADLFGRFTEIALPIVAEGVEWVCTINEPNGMAKVPGQATEPITSSQPIPDERIPDERISDVLVLAHRRSREVLAGVPAVKSGWTIASQAVCAASGSEQIARDYGYPREDIFLEAARGDDFVGVQAYSRTVIGPEGPVPVPEGTETTLTGWEYFPPALGIGVRHAWSVTAGVPIIVTENGIATADDTRRIAYTHEALTGLHQAISDGINVLGYMHWSALDNYEWGSYSPTFGLIAVNRATFARTPKPSARWLGDIAKSNALPARLAPGQPQPRPRSAVTQRSGEALMREGRSTV